MIEASPSRGTPEQWTAEQAARAMGVVDEADGEALGVEGAASGEIGMAGGVGREQPNARGSQWVTGGAAMGLALAVVAATWWSGAGNGDSWKIPVHAGAVVALIAGERTPNSGTGDFNSSNGSSHMKIQTTAAAALLGAAAIAFQAQAGDAVQWRVEDGGNGHWYGIVGGAGTIGWHESRGQAQDVGADLASVDSDTEWGFIRQIGSTPTAWNGQHGPWLGGYQDETATDFSEPAGGWRWVTGGPLVFTAWVNGQPSNSCDFHPENYLHMYGSPSNTIWNDVGEASTCSVSPVRAAVIEWSADCNSDGIVDYGQILSGQLADTNTNGIPDICEARLSIRVPADQPTIQAAIDAAPLNTQCIVAVSAGTYAGPIDFKGKSVIVRGAGASQTVISGSAGSTLSVVRFTGGEPAFAALENVSIRGGVTGSPFPGSPQFQVGGGLFAYNSAASVRDCVFENNTAAFGGGAYVWNCTGSIERCTFRNNRAGADGAGIQLTRGNNTVVDTIVENNTANSRGGGMHIVDGTPHLVRTVVRNNISSNIVGGVSWVPAGNAAAFLSIDGCNVTGNTAAVVQGGIGILEDGATTKVSLHGTSVCGNLPRPNVAGRFNDLGGNVICDCTGDLNLDGVVNGADLGLMLSSWGPCGSSCPYDLNVDGVVNGADLGLMLSAWGTCGS